MAGRGLRRDKRGQFLILISLGIVMLMITLSSILAYTAVSPVHFSKTSFREVATELNLDFRRILVIALTDVAKELDLKASVRQYLNYTKLDEYPQAKDKGYESLTEWLKITLLKRSGLGLNLTVSKPTFQCNWGSSQGYSRAETDMTLDILSYGFYGWKSKVTVELNLTILILKEIDENVTSFSFNLKREQGVPVSGLAASSVKVLFQGKRNMFNETDPASIKLAYFGGGNYLLTCATRNMTSPIVKMILQDPDGIVVGAYSELTKEDDTAGPKTTVSVSKTRIPRSGTKVITLNAIIDDTYPGGGWSNIVAAEYSIDAPGADGTGTPMVPVDGAFDSPKEDVWAQINLTGWALGNYIIYVHGKDAEGNWGDFTSISLKVVESLKMHVASIDVYWEWSFGRYRYVRAAVTIVDSNGNPVWGAMVYGHWSGTITGNDFGYTDNNGRWITNRQRARYSGTYTFTVDNVVLSDWIYDKGANVETSDSISG